MIQDPQQELHERILQWRSRLEAARERLGAHRHPELARAVDEALASIANHARGGFMGLAPTAAARLLGWFESTRFLPERGRSLEDAHAAWRKRARSGSRAAA